MSTLSTNGSGELHLTLRGEAENCILTTIRRLPYWQRVVFERDPSNTVRCIGITLIADVAHEPTIREILKRSFNLSFPEAGGSSELAAQYAATPQKARRHYSKS